jgi:hypothetical protein
LRMEVRKSPMVSLDADMFVVFVVYQDAFVTPGI